MLFTSGAVALHTGHASFACPPLSSPFLSTTPALPPPRFVVAASILAAISLAVCFFGFAFPVILASPLSSSVPPPLVTPLVFPLVSPLLPLPVVYQASAGEDRARAVSECEGEKERERRGGASARRTTMYRRGGVASGRSSGFVTGSSSPSASLLCLC
ncbi:hypothetical protein KC19_7G016900 [Ceratodon purpureus]|uniref:Uncharacterized protein n=1 Tax=Ceratodon purpureus TaxID=3225 RepID=A0A8T0H6P8_CERPU|nr:hypothetical protein KC19_7G016900 [Ceratodon purpureus]